MLVDSESKVGMYSVIKPWKAFARHYAWVVVAATPNLSVGVQMQHLMVEYKKCVVLMVEGRLQYQGDWMPTQPAELTILGSEAALQLFLQSTAKVGSSTTEAALYHKVKADVKLVHQFMSDWCTLCPCASRQSTSFLPATVPDGQCRDGVFAQILLSRESYRTNELNVCFKYFTQYASNGHESSACDAYTQLLFNDKKPAVRADRAAEALLPHCLGLMDVVCPHCSARFFKNEHFHCCSNGAVELPMWRQPPTELMTLLNQDQFSSKIRAYNCAMSLASSVFTDFTPRDKGPATFKMGGRSWRLLPKSLEPVVKGEQKFAQIYSMSVSEATGRRSQLMSSSTLGALNPSWLASLHNMLLLHNPLVRSFVQSYNSSVDWNISIGSIDPLAAATNDTMVGLLLNGGSDLKSTVVPMTADGNPNGFLIMVPDLDPYYQPLHFVLLFPYGEPQWGMHLSRIKDDNRKRKRSTAPVSIFDYLSFHIQRRSVINSVDTCTIHDFGRLFEEWFVDCFLQSENHKLKYLKFNQSKFRTESRVKLRQQLGVSIPPHQIGSPATHLPSSFLRGQRFFRELYADAMTLPAKFGGIDYFLTFTTNPSWPEIVGNTNASNGMNAPDLYCRVFHMKMNALLHDVLHNGVLGVVVAYTFAVEFQQRGLPHLHALFFVREEDKPTSSAVVDMKVAAQLPDADLDPEYFQLVKKHMMHGPCGCLNPSHYCMKHGECRFGYPKRLQNVTTIPADGYTQLARPFGRSVQMTDTFTADNSWVVPHNKFLLCKYNAHINVECSASISVVEYMFSYVYKGTQTSTASVVNPNDEIRQFSDGRITSAAEAIWSVLGFPAHGQSPSVQRLGCNLPNDPNVNFDSQATAEHILDCAEGALCSPSHLKSWFKLNRVDAFARTLLYVQIPEFYTWNKLQSEWCRRKSAWKCLGRVHPADFTNRERWALRTLLLHSRGSQSEEDLRTVELELKPTFWEAAISLGLFDDDKEYHACLSSMLLSADQLRSVLLIILLHCHPKDPQALVLKFFDELTEDFPGNGNQKMQQLLQSIENCVDVPLEELGLDWILMTTSGAISCKKEYLESFVSNSGLLGDLLPLNPGQQIAHDIIISDATRGKGTTFTLMAPAGSGKTYLIAAILNTARRSRLRVVTCASSALAASLLGHSRTAHSLFKIPINIDEHSICKPSGSYKNWLRSIQMFIWDEISMAHKWALDSVDRLLRDLHASDQVFGGVTMVLSGDMRQLLPIHRFAPDPAAYSLLTCSWFSNTTRLFLNQNMRSADDAEWSDFVSKVGDGCHAIFPVACICESVDALIAKVWPDSDFQLPGNRSILTLTREDARSINLRILDAYPGVVDYAISKDVALDCDAALFPIEFVNSCSVSGLADHILILKKGAPYMLNHNVSAALCNGTRVIYHRRIGKLLELEITSGDRRGEFHYLPRIVQVVRNAKLPFTLSRTQFPIQSCFAMTVHKSQGQTLDVVGIFFTRDAWAHGLLYVAVSRVRRAAHCFIYGAVGKEVINSTCFSVLQFLRSCASSTSTSTMTTGA